MIGRRLTRREGGGGEGSDASGGSDGGGAPTPWPMVVPIGVPLPDCSIELLDPDTLVRVPDGSVGEICVAGSFLADGYHRLPEATARAFPTLVLDGDGGASTPVRR